MAIFRGVGGSGDSSDNSFLQEVTAQASAASASAVLAQASANSILTLTAATGDAGTNVSYNASTGVLTVPRGADGTDASVTAANVTSVLTGGTGISIASNGTITNDSPDQTVALTGAGGTSVTGTYPNFTITSSSTLTDAQIKTAYENNADTNAFTDADHTKLDGIEASADVTDTANVTAAGALMDSEVTNLAQVKAFDSSDYATSAQGTLATNALPKAGGQMTGNITFSGTQTVDGRDLSVDGTKLDALEQTFSSRFSHFFNAALNLYTTLSTLGYTYQTKETTNSKNTVDLTLETRHQDLYDTNDAEYYVSLTAPDPSDEDTVFLGNIAGVVSDTTKGKKIGYFTGDKTKYFSEYCGLAIISNGTGTLNTNGLSYYYDATNDRTYMGVHLYQTNNFNTDSGIYVHPFDWETSGTVLNGTVTPLDAAVYDGTVDSVHTKKHYLGYFKSDVELEIRAQEPSANTDGNNVTIKIVEGAINQVQD